MNNEYDVLIKLGKETVDEITEVALGTLEIAVSLLTYDERKEKKQQQKEHYESLSWAGQAIEDHKTANRQRYNMFGI